MVEFERSTKSPVSLPNSSLTARLLALNYLKSFACVLDFSSIVSDSHVFKTLFENDTRLVCAHKFLSQERRSQKYFWKDELNNKNDVIEFYSTSSKQYCLRRKGDKAADIIKCKGVRRSAMKRSVNAKTFKLVTRYNRESDKATIFSIKRHDFNLYLTFTKKRLLSRYSNKRFFRDKFSDKNQYFGFPLHLCNILNKA